MRPYCLLYSLHGVATDGIRVSLCFNFFCWSAEVNFSDVFSFDALEACGLACGVGSGGG